MFDRRQHGPRRIRRRMLVGQIWILRLELPNLSIGAPLPVGVPCVAEVGLGDPVEPTTPRRSARRVRGRSPRCERTRSRAPIGWRLRRGARHPAPAPRCERPRRRPARRDSGNSRDSTSPPIPRVVGSGRLTPGRAAGVQRRLQYHSTPHGSVRHRSERLTFQSRTALSRTAAEHAMTRRQPQRSGRRRNAPAASLSSTGVQRMVPQASHRPTNCARTAVPRTAPR